jgi:hypothetical protein
MRLRPLGCKNPGTHYGTLTAVKNLSLQVFEGHVYEGDVITLDNFTRECYIPATCR